MIKPVKFIAIAGPSASGKTFLANKLAALLGNRQTVIISQDCYYKDWSKLPFKKRETINFDHPNAFDFSLMRQHLKQLKSGELIEIPQYSYRLHKRLKRRVKIVPKKWIIIEGLLILHRKNLRNLFDVKVYVDIDIATALVRRIKRDLRHRGETVVSIYTRYFNDVFPMQKKFVEEQMKFVEMVINGSDFFNKRLLTTIVQKIIT